RHLAHHFVQASCYHVDPVLSALQDFGKRINGVICAGTDAPHVMAAIGDEYAVVSPTPDTALLSTDKFAQAEALFAARVNVPSFDGELYRVAASHPPPWVIKPVDSRGARGVFRVQGVEDPWDRWREIAKAESPTGRAMIQKWIDGQQISSESLVQNGEILWTAFADRNYDRLEEFAPYVIEDGCDMPSEIASYHENDWEQKARAELQKCVDALTLENGVLKGDLVWDGHDIWVIEVATRLSGGRMCSDITPVVFGVDFVGMAIRIALGDYIWPGEISPYLQRHCSQRFLFPVKPQAHPDRGPHVIAAGVTRQEAQNNAAKQLKLLDASVAMGVREPVL
ncbi:hypothetical protein LCGC14_3061180, partial [marine sediment metagenome]